MNLNKKLTFLILLIFIANLNFLLSKNITIINEDIENFNFNVFFEDPSENHEIENIILTIGLPSNKAPKITVNPILITENNHFNFNQFYKPIETYAKWERIEKYRDLHIGILIISPTKNLNTNNYAKKLNINIEFEKNLKSNNSVSSTLQSEIYKNKISNWNTAQNWINNNIFKINKKSEDTSIEEGNIDGDWYKIYIDNDGVYKIGIDELNEAGINTQSLNPESIHMFTSLSGGRPIDFSIGSEIPNNLTQISIKINDANDGNFDNQDEIIFYARGARGFENLGENIFYKKNPFSNYNIIWLLIPFDQNLKGKRIERRNEIIDDPVLINYGIGYSFLDNDIINPFENGLNWVDIGINTSKTHLSSISLHHPLKELKSTAYINLMGNSTSNESIFPSHLVEISQTDNENNSLKNLSWVGKTLNSTSIDLNSNLLNDGLNLISFKNISSDQSSKVHVDDIVINYFLSLKWDGEQFNFWSPNNLLSTRFGVESINSDVNIFDITSFNSPIEHEITLSGDTGYFEKQFSNSEKKQFIVFNKNELLKVSELVKIENHNFSNLRNSKLGIDHIIIAPEEFLEPAQNLKNHRKNSFFASIESIYDEFSGGNSNPNAIKIFLKYVKNNWKASSGTTFPLYVLLLGDGDYDYRNITGNSNIKIPTYQSNYISGTSSDDRFTYLDAYTPEFSIGRLPAGTLEEAEIMINKIINYESNPNIGLWRKNLTLIADDFSRPNFGPVELTHTKNSEYISNLIPIFLDIKKLYLEDYPEINDGSQFGVVKPSATKNLFEILNNGTSLINYIGHGSEYQWSQENLLSSSRGDILNIQTNEKLPIWIAGTCSWGKYDLLNTNSMSEELLKSNNNGAIAVISTNGLISFNANRNFLIDLFESFFPNGEVSNLPIGSIYSSIKNGSESSEMFHLLGDPGMKIAIPSNQVEINTINPDSVNSLSKGSFSGFLSNEQPNSGKGFINVKEPFKIINKTYVDDNYEEIITYKIPGEDLFKGKISFDDKKFSGSFIVPKDITINGRGKVSVYLYDQNGWEGLGSNENVVFTPSTSSSIDKNGPLISFSNNGRIVETGDNIYNSNSIYLNLSDPLGINLTNDIGHGIMIWYDDDELNKVNITNRFLYDENSFTSGSVEILLKDIDFGNINISAEAWDNANNLSQKQIFFNFNDGNNLKLSNLFNHPNPFAENTNFGFEINEESNIEIKIFTLSGQLINILDPFDIFYGYSRISWNGKDFYNNEIANGVYIYEITAKSIMSEKIISEIGKLAKYK